MSVNVMPEFSWFLLACAGDYGYSEALRWGIYFHCPECLVMFVVNIYVCPFAVLRLDGFESSNFYSLVFDPQLANFLSIKDVVVSVGSW